MTFWDLCSTKPYTYMSVANRLRLLSHILRSVVGHLFRYGTSPGAGAPRYRLRGSRRGRACRAYRFGIMAARAWTSQGVPGHVRPGRGRRASMANSVLTELTPTLLLTPIWIAEYIIRWSQITWPVAPSTGQAALRKTPLSVVPCGVRAHPEGARSWDVPSIGTFSNWLEVRTQSLIAARTPHMLPLDPDAR